MRSVNFAYLGAESEAAKYAKKGTTTDVTLYNAKQDDTHLNLVTPSRYPEKISSLLVALDLADAIILHPAQADRTLGETVVGADLFRKTRGFLRITGGLDPSSIQGLLAKTSLKSLELNQETDGAFRERLYAGASATTTGSTLVPVDHAFPVKGVGTVILGLVRAGEVTVHQSLQAYPSDKKIEVRSVQIHDVDHKVGPIGSRVGLAVKGIEATDLPRGTILAQPGSLKVLSPDQPATVRIEFSPFSKWQPRAGAVLHLFHVLQDVVVRIDDVRDSTPGGASLTLKPESPLTVVPGQPAVLVDLDNKVQRFVGRVALPG